MILWKGSSDYPHGWPSSFDKDQVIQSRIDQKLFRKCASTDKFLIYFLEMGKFQENSIKSFTPPRSAGKCKWRRLRLEKLVHILEVIKFLPLRFRDVRTVRKTSSNLRLYREESFWSKYCKLWQKTIVVFRMSCNYEKKINLKKGRFWTKRGLSIETVKY